MKISGDVFSAALMEFPPCSSLAQVEFCEQMIFGLIPSLTEFIRPITLAEREAGIGNGYPAALVLKADRGIVRLYGTSIPLN
jgi:hypothetical protein